MIASKVLARTALFSGLSAAELELLAASTRRRHFRKGEFIFRLDDPGTACYVIESGLVKIGVESPEGKQITLAILGAGEPLGELALLDSGNRSADAVALEACDLLELSATTFQAFVREHPCVAIELLTSIACRLRHTDSLLEDAVFLHVPGRLAKLLLDLAERQGKRTSLGACIDLPLTQTELAALAGTTRESVNKWLSFYHQRGLIRLDGGKIFVTRPRELRQQVH